jgi:hypothetical protein
MFLMLIFIPTFCFLSLCGSGFMNIVRGCLCYCGCFSVFVRFIIFYPKLENVFLFWYWNGLEYVQGKGKNCLPFENVWLLSSVFWCINKIKVKCRRNRKDNFCYPRMLQTSKQHHWTKPFHLWNWRSRRDKQWLQSLCLNH